MNRLKRFAWAAGFCLLVPVVAQADLITFNFTGGLVVTAPEGNLGVDYTQTPPTPVMPLSASLVYNTVSGIGSSSLSVTLNNAFFGLPATFHDISMTRLPNSNLINGQVLVDWAWSTNMPMNVVWDATGLLNAINYGLQAGDIISGTNLYRDTNHNGVGDPGELLTNVSSATPYSDILQTQQGYNFLQGPAPMAATSASLGFASTTPLSGAVGYIDIGSGNSMHVVSVVAVPIPAAIWLLGSGLVGLLNFSRKRKR